VTVTVDDVVMAVATWQTMNPRATPAFVDATPALRSDKVVYVLPPTSSAAVYVGVVADTLSDTTWTMKVAPTGTVTVGLNAMVADADLL